MSRVSRAVAGLLERMSNVPAGRGLAGAAVSLAKTAATGRPHWIRYDTRGWWRNRQLGAVFFSPTFHTSTFSALANEVDDYWCFQAAIPVGGIVVDVGAGVGDHVLVFSRRVGAGGRVVAIEAHPATARCLRLTVAENRVTNTYVIQEAAWNAETTIHMSDESTHERNRVDGERGGIAIRARPVDAMLAPLAIPRIDLLKMNIEGAELTALGGMPDTLKRARSVVVSCHDFLATDRPDDPRRTKAGVMAALKAAGFEIATRPDAPYPWVRDYVYGRRRA